MAIFEEHPILSGHHNNGDGTSRSSAGTSSPDVFAYGDHAVLGNGGEVNKTDQNHESDDSHDIIITSRDLHAG